MRRFDKNLNIQKANLLAEQRYLESKGLVNENYELTEEGRISMSEFFGETTDNVETLFKMFSKYQPTDSWFMTVGYVNNARNSEIPNTLKIGDIKTFEGIAAKLESPTLMRYAKTLMDSPDWETVKQTYDKDQERFARGLKSNTPPTKDFHPKRQFKNPFSAVEKSTKDPETGKINTEILEPAKLYSTKSFTVQWGNIKQKSDRDSELLAIRAKHGLTGDEGAIPTDDKRGGGYSPVPGTPFKQHQNTKNVMIDFYAKGGVRSHESKYFINFNGEIAELTPEEKKFIWKEWVPASMPDRLSSMSNQEAAQELFKMEQLYEMKNFKLQNISYIICSMNIDGENKKFSYINRNAAPSGLNPGEFKEFIEASLPKSLK
jgi:hypothetical protein